MIRRHFLKRMAMAAVASGLLGTELLARREGVFRGGGFHFVVHYGDGGVVDLPPRMIVFDETGVEQPA